MSVWNPYLYFINWNYGEFVVSLFALACLYILLVVIQNSALMTSGLAIDDKAIKSDRHSDIQALIE